MKEVQILVALMLLFGCSEKKVRGFNGLPSCMVTMLEKQKTEKMEPVSITRYEYKGAQVFYVTAPCCDQYNSVYDSDCKFMGSPDGGLDGNGDGKLADFHSAATDKKIVWKNE